jgi:hypothetical protein
MQYGTEPDLTLNSSPPTGTAANGADVPNGMIVPGTGLNIKACTDGTSKTLMLCETLEPAINSWYDGTTAWTTAISPVTVSISTPTPSRSTALANNTQGYWIAGTSVVTALNVGPAPTPSVVYSNATSGYCFNPLIISWGPSSGHSGGVVIHAAVDGSIHSINSDIDPSVYMHIITRAGREPDSFPDTSS